MVRMIRDMPHRSGYSDEIDNAMIVRFSYHSAPPEVGGPQDVHHSSEPRGEYPAAFRCFGSEGLLRVAVTKRKSQAKLLDLKLEVQTASAKEGPQVTGISFRFKSQDDENMLLIRLYEALSR